MKQKGRDTGDVDWAIIRKIKQAVQIPILANGGIEHATDVERCLQVCLHSHSVSLHVSSCAYIVLIAGFG